MNVVTLKVKEPARILASHPGSARNISAMLLGGRLLNKMLGKRHLSVSDMPKDMLFRLLDTYGMSSLAGLYEDVGTGKLPASAVVRSLLELSADV